VITGTAGNGIAPIPVVIPIGIGHVGDLQAPDCRRSTAAWTLRLTSVERSIGGAFSEVTDTLASSPLMVRLAHLQPVVGEVERAAR